MRSTVKALLSDLVKQIIYENLNHHRSNHPSGDIVLVGSRRSGSTLLMQIVAQSPGIKYVNQPFSKYTSIAAHNKGMPLPAGGNFIRPGPEERNQLENYVREMQSGERHVQEPWRFWRNDFYFRSNRLVLKTTDAQYLVPILQEMGLTVLLYFRHPIPQSISCMRNKWGHHLDQFAAHYHLRHEFLNQSQNDLIDEVLADSDLFSKFVLAWCLENMPLFDLAAAGTPTFFFENTVKEPEQTMERLATVCKIEPNARMRAMFDTQSLSVKALSDQESAQAIRQRDKDKIVGRWMEKVDVKTIERVDRILGHFENVPYKATSQWPISYSEII